MWNANPLSVKDAQERPNMSVVFSCENHFKSLDFVARYFFIYVDSKDNKIKAFELVGINVISYYN